MQINLKKFLGLQQDLHPWPAVLYHLCYEDWYIGSRPNCWVHLNQWKEWYMKSNTNKYDHVTPVLKNLRWLPVKTNLYFKEAVVAFKCMTGMSIRGNVSRLKTRHSQSLNIPLLKLKQGRGSFSYRIIFVNIWISVPSEIEPRKWFK